MRPLIPPCPFVCLPSIVEQLGNSLASLPGLLLALKSLTCFALLYSDHQLTFPQERCIWHHFQIVFKKENFKAIDAAFSKLKAQWRREEFIQSGRSKESTCQVFASTSIWGGVGNKHLSSLMAVAEVLDGAIFCLVLHTSLNVSIQVHRKLATTAAVPSVSNIISAFTVLG